MKSHWKIGTGKRANDRVTGAHRRWWTTFLLAVTIAVVAGVSPGQALWAQSGHAGGPSIRQIDARPPLPAIRFNIPAQPIAEALIAFGRASGLQVSVESALIGNVLANAVVGRMPADQALEQLLAGTDLVARYVGANGVVIVRPSVRVAQAETATEEETATDVLFLDPIIVTGEKFERPFLETFTSVGVATEEDIEDYRLYELRKVFNTMANVRDLDANQGNNGFMIRGIGADGVTQPSNNLPVISVIIDGVTQSAEGLKRGSRGTWDMEQIEVLRGPQSTLIGRNALAGAVIMESVDPTYYNEVILRGVLAQQERTDGAFVFSGPIVENQLAYRVSGEVRQQFKDITVLDPANAELIEDKYRNFRGKLLIEPEAIDDLSVVLMASHVYDQPASNTVSWPFFDRIYSSASTFTELRKMSLQNYSADATYDFSDRYTLRSITAANLTDLEINNAPGAIVFIRDDTRSDTDFTQEFRLEIGESEDVLSGVVGAFYGDFSQELDSYITLGGLVFQDGIFKNETESIAAYADLRYRLFERFILIGGLRYQLDRVHNLIDYASTFGATYVNGSNDFTALLPKFGVAYELTDNQAIGLTASQGYRQGFTEVLVGTNQSNIVDPEYMWTYELAYRLTSPDQRLTFATNVFYNDYTDQQLTVLSSLPPLTNTFNIGKSHSYGAEFEGRYDFGNGVSVFGALGLLHTEFDEFEDISCLGGSCAGNEYPEAPAVTAAAGVTYQHVSGFFAAADVDYTSSYYSWGQINNEPVYKVDGRFLANISIGYEYENLKASVFVDNLFDEDYLTGIGSPTSASIGDGRVIGVELRATF